MWKKMISVNLFHLFSSYLLLDLNTLNFSCWYSVDKLHLSALPRIHFGVFFFPKITGNRIFQFYNSVIHGWRDYSASPLCTPQILAARFFCSVKTNIDNCLSNKNDEDFFFLKIREWGRKSPKTKAALRDLISLRNTSTSEYCWYCCSGSLQQCRVLWKYST